MKQDIITLMDLPTESTIPWKQTANLGDGIAAPGGELLKSAVELFKAEPGDVRKEEFDVTTVTNEKEIRKLVSIDAHAGFNAAAIEASAQTHVENNLSVSERSSTIVIKYKIVWDQAIASPLPCLTAEAWSLYERSPSEFHIAYGHYFIVGFTKESELMIFARLKGTSRESVQKISAEIQTKFNGAGYKIDAEVTTNLENSVREQNCQLEIGLYKIGVTDNQDSEIPGLTLSEIPDHVKDFQKRAVGTKTRAILVHYHRVEPKISTKTDVSADMFNGANHFYENLVVARVLKSRLPKHYSEEIGKLLEKIEDDAQKYVPRDLSGDINKLNELSDRIDNWLSDVRTLKLYQRLWRDVAANPGTKKGKDWGVIKWNDPELSHLEFDIKSKKLRKPYTKPGWRTGTLRIPDEDVLQNRKICGIELIANKSDNGSHSLSDGGLNQNFVKFTFKSKYDRGFNWTVKVWSIPEEMANFVPDDL